MRVFKNILTGLCLGIIIVLVMALINPDAGKILSDTWDNWMSDASEIAKKSTKKIAGDTFTALFADGQQVSSSTDTNDSGITGTGESFDVTYNIYYEMLDDNEKQLYAQMYANASSGASSFAPVVQLSTDQIQTVFEAVFYDHPKLFWLDTGYSYQYTEDGTVVAIVMKYNDTINNLSEAQNAFNNQVNAILQDASQYASPADKERCIHDDLLNLIQYDQNASLNQSAYSALVNHSTVCAGYAKAFQYVMNQAGIPTYYVVGTSEGEDHAWNLVYLNGTYVNVDLTWDDTGNSPYRFYNLTDDEMNQSHTRTGLSVNLP